jgi:hypothetical protein
MPQAVITVNPLKPSHYIIHHQKFSRNIKTVYVLSIECVVFYTDFRTQRLFPSEPLTNSFLSPRRNVFTARVGLYLEVKFKLNLVFKGLYIQRTLPSRLENIL